MTLRFLFLSLIALALVISTPGCKKDDHDGGNPLVPTQPGELRITAGDFLPNGSSFAFWWCTFDPDEFTPDTALADTAFTGSQFTWNIGLPYYGRRGIDSVHYVEPSETPQGNLFPTATRAVTVDRHGWYDYYRVTNGGYYSLGWAYSLTDTFHFNPPLQILKLPLGVGTSWTAVYSGYGTDGWDTLYWVDTLYALADGWGTVNWPFGADTCLRLSGTHHSWYVYHGYCWRDLQEREYAWVDAHGQTVVDVLEVVDQHAVRAVYVSMRVDSASTPGPMRESPGADLPPVQGFGSPRNVPRAAEFWSALDAAHIPRSFNPENLPERKP